MAVPLPSSARELTDDELELVELARRTIDAHTDAGPDEDGVHAELVALGGARAAGLRDITHIVAVGIRSVLIEDLMPLASTWSFEEGSR
jgi:cytidine deaminase